MKKKKGAKKHQAAAPQIKRPVVSPEVAARARRTSPAPKVFAPALHPPGVLPSGHALMAQDDGISAACNWASEAANAYASEGLVFLGYAYLAEIAQRPEYRRLSETIATEMTRKWIKVTSTGEEDKSAKIKAINVEMKRLDVQGVFREAAEQDGLFGRSHIYVDLGTTNDRDELMTDIGDGHNGVSKVKVGKGALRRLKSVEAVWCYPNRYNSNDPLSPDWYRPSAWFVQGKEVHASRLLTFIGREVPDLLKPAYSFGGLSLSQMAKPYVDNWLRTRQSVSDLVHSFSVSGVKVDLVKNLEGGENGQQLFDRLDLFTNLRDNRGTMALDKEEEFFNVSTPLGTLDKLQAQSQEHICSVSGIPLVKYTGISPTGLNASSEGEIRSFYDWIHAYQGSLFTANLHRVLGFIQLSLFGEVDPDIGFEYEPLWAMSEKELAEVRKTEADTGAVLITAGVLSPLEERKRIANDPEAAYASLDADAVPEKPITLVEQAQIMVGVTTAVDQAVNGGLVEKATGLRQLVQSGTWPVITADDITAAEEEDPPLPEMATQIPAEGAPEAAE